MTPQTTSYKHNIFKSPAFTSNIALVVLGLLTVIGAFAGIWRLFAGLGDTTNLSDSYSWGIWIGFDFTLIAFAGTGFTMAAVVHILHLKQFRDALRPAIWAGLLGYVAVLLLLVLDLGRPDRFYHFILFWNVHSPLFEISWCVLLYTTILLVETSPFLLERLERLERFNVQKLLRWARNIMLPITILGVTLSSLHQSTLGTLYLNMPHRLHELWYTPVLSLFFFVSSVMAGLSVAILTYVAATRISGKPVKQEIVRGLGKGIAWVGTLYLLLKLGDLALTGEWRQLFTFTNPSLGIWIELGVCVVLPILLFAAPFLRRHTHLLLVAPLLVLFGVLLNRFNATMFAQSIPDGVSYVPHPLEWLSTIGILAGVVLVWWLGIRFLVIFDR